MKRDNRGVSLIEIMIVVALLALLVGIGVVSISAMLGRPAQECAQKIAYSLDRHRTVAASKVSASYTLYIADGDLYLAEKVNNGSGEGTTTTKLGNSVIVTYELDDGSTGTLGSLELGYDRSSGRFKNVPAGSTTYCRKITVSRAGRTCEVFLEPLTGKVYLN